MSEPLELSPSNALQQWDDAQAALDEAIQRYLDSTVALQSSLFGSTHSVNAASVRGTLAKNWLDGTPIPDKHSKLPRAQERMNQIRNSLLPINALPLEIFLRILQFTAFNTFQGQYNGSIPSSYQQEDHRGLIGLTHVCSYWRAVLIETPSFWSQFVFDTQYRLENECDRAAVYSSRKNGTPQVLTFYEQIKNRALYPRHFSMMTKVIEPRLDNLTQLALLNLHSIPLVTRTITYWLENGKPGMLRSLTIQLEPNMVHPIAIYTGSDEQVQQTELMLSPIRTLSLRGIAFSWNSPIYRNLVILRIGNLHPAIAPTIHQMIGALSACPLLHTLRLYRMTISPGIPTPLKSVTLTELEHLNLALLSSESVDLLLSKIVPEGKDLSVRLAFPTWDAQSFEVLHPFLARTNVTRLFIEQCAPRESGGVINRCLSALPNLHTLILDFGMKNGNSCLSGLTNPGETNSTRVPLCSSLHTLYLVTGSASVQAVQQVIETHPLLRKLRFWACHVEPFEEELHYWLTPFIKDVRFDSRLDTAALFDWYHVMT